MIDRREFSTQLLAAGLSLGLAPLARAQGTPVEGQQYVRLSQPQPVLTPGKVEVIEFFWYGCPHCFEFEPMLEAWIKTLPAGPGRQEPIRFIRVKNPLSKSVVKACKAAYPLPEIYLL